MIKPLFTFFFVLIFCMAILAGTCLAEVAVIKLDYREATDLLPMVQSLLSPEGKASADARTNALIINDTGESVSKIRAFVADMDKLTAQVKVRFKFQETSVSTDRDISASGKVSGKKWSVSTGETGDEGVHVRAQDRKVNRQDNIESFILVMSGSPGYIWVGKDVPFTERWITLCHTYAHVVKTVKFQRVETGFEVRPVVSGERVHIEIVPRISSMDSGTGVIRLTEASTKLTVQKGQWVTIGGNSENSNEAIRDILLSRSSSGSSSSSLSLMVE